MLFDDLGAPGVDVLRLGGQIVGQLREAEQPTAGALLLPALGDGDVADPAPAENAFQLVARAEGRAEVDAASRVGEGRVEERRQDQQPVVRQWVSPGDALPAEARPAGMVCAVKKVFAVVGAALGALVGIGFLIDDEWWLSTDGWSALGQWVGGVGAVAAIAVALYVAHRDWASARTAAVSAQKARAFLITAIVDDGKLTVTNGGPEAVTQLVVPRVHFAGGKVTADTTEFKPETRAVLLPGATWDAAFPVPSGGAEAALVVALFTGSAEVRWTDLQGTHWVRVGNGEPTMAVTSDWTAEVTEEEPSGT